MQKITNHLTRATMVGAVALFTACASATTPTQDTGAPRPLTISMVSRGEKPARTSHDLVVANELGREKASNLFTALSRVRPDFLRVRGSTASFRSESPEIDVFLNGQYAGGVEVLRSVPAEFVSRVQLVQRSQGFVTHGMQLRGEHALFVTLVNR